MTISIEACRKNGVSLGEVLLLLAIYHKQNLNLAEASLVEKGYITADRTPYSTQKWIVFSKGAELLNNVMADSMELSSSEDELTNLASTLKDIFPKGKKEGTAYYWTEGVPLIVKRLKLFFKKYGDKYTNDQIIEATKKYVESFNGDYKYMKLLKYFIFKDKIGAARNVEEDSDLVTYIENNGQEDLSETWMTELR